jgi:hypothetical protein
LRAHGERDGYNVFLVEGEYVLGISAFWQGEFQAAEAHFEAAVERYRPEDRRAHLLHYGQDPKVVCLSRLANTLWFLGRPGAATQARDAALALGDAIGHPYSRAVALLFASLLAIEMRDPERLRLYVARLEAMRSEHDPRQTRDGRESFAGYVDVLDGRKEIGIARIERALEDVRGAQPAPGTSSMLARVLLEAYAAAGDARAGLVAADAALEPGRARVCEAEFRRLRAEFLAALGAPAHEVEAELARALEVSRRQGAKLFELRTLASLLRHRIELGDIRATSEARDRLAAVVETLPEGQDTPDGREAATLLAPT